MTQPGPDQRPDPSDVSAALRRAGVRAVYHLLRAGVEGLKALESVVDELGKLSHPPRDEGEEEPRRERIELE